VKRLESSEAKTVLATAREIESSFDLWPFEIFPEIEYMHFVFLFVYAFGHAL